MKKAISLLLVIIMTLSLALPASASRTSPEPSDVVRVQFLTGVSTGVRDISAITLIVSGSHGAIDWSDIEFRITKNDQPFPFSNSRLRLRAGREETVSTPSGQGNRAYNFYLTEAIILGDDIYDLTVIYKGVEVGTGTTYAPPTSQQSQTTSTSVPPGTFTTADALTALRAAVGLETLTGLQMSNLRLRENATTADALRILRNSIGLSIRGNNLGNISNGGYVAIDAGWVYYTGKDGGIYKMRVDGTGRQRLTDSENLSARARHNLAHINVVEDWVYYLARGTKPSFNRNIYCNQSWAIYRVDKDGNNQSKVFDIKGNFSSFLYMLVIDDWIYFSASGWSEDAGTFRVRTNGTGYQRIHEHGIDLNISGDYIYSISIDGFVRTKVDGTGREVIRAADYYSHLTISGNRMYYIRWTELEEYIGHDIRDSFVTLYSSNLDGTDERVLVNRIEKVNGYLIVEGGWIYYMERDKHTLNRVRIDGTNRTTLVDFREMFTEPARDGFPGGIRSPHNISVVGNQIFILQSGGLSGGGIYTVPVTGGKLTLLTEIEPLFRDY
jgi:hypothetical protein